MDFNFKKKFGQNFLADKNIANKIADSVNPLPRNLVIEIGCGDGRLTKLLCSKFDNVIGYEIDNELKEILSNNLKQFDNYRIIFDDFLKRNIKEDISSYDVSNIYVVANLPYYITTAIIEKIIDSKIDICAMNFMVQKEVGDRFSALPGSKNYGSLSVYLNYYFSIKKLFIVSRNSFVPRPNVDSIVISFLKKDNRRLAKNEDVFFKLVKDSFKYKRKTLKNNLKEYDLIKVENVLKQHNLSLNVRAEELSLDIFLDISDGLG